MPMGGHLMMFCPFCDNAHPYKPSMSVTRVDGGLLYNCFRATCGTSGYHGSMPSSMMVRDKEAKTDTNPMLMPTRHLTAEETVFLSGAYDLTVEEIENNEIRWLKYAKGIVMPLYTTSGAIFGYNTKYWNKDKYKSVLYKQSNYPNLHWAYAHDMEASGWGKIIIVEDQLSAIRVSRFGQGVALLGTQMNEDKIVELAKYRPEEVIIALDPDATSKAVDIQQKYALSFKKLRVAPLSSDPKDMTHKKLKKELGV